MEIKISKINYFRVFKKNGHEIHEIRCREALNNYCLVMMAEVPHKNSNLFSSRKKQICHDCMNKSDILSNEFQFINIDIEKITDEQDKIINFELSKINKKNF